MPAAFSELRLSLAPPPAGLIAAEFHLACPPGAGPLRAILGLSAYASGGLFHHPRWRALARDTGAALLCYDLRKPMIDGAITDVAPDADGFAALQAGLTALAERSGRTELCSAPLAFAGLSKSADQAVHYADRAGPRALAAVAFQMPVGLKPHEAVLKRLAAVPVLAPFAELDRFFAPEMMATQLAFVHAPESPPHPWAGVFRAGLPHHETGEQGFITDWLRAIMDARLPASPGAPIRPLDYAAGWHGELTLSPAPAAGRLHAHTSIRPAADPTAPAPHRRHWLPNRAIAEAWQTACAATDTREEVPGLATGQPDDHA